MEYKSILKKLIINEKIKKIVKVSYGKTFIIEGKIKTPVGIDIKIRTVWIIRDEETVSRFVTAYPL